MKPSISVPSTSPTTSLALNRKAGVRCPRIRRTRWHGLDQRRCPVWKRNTLAGRKQRTAKAAIRPPSALRREPL